MQVICDTNPPLTADFELHFVFESVEVPLPKTTDAAAVGCGAAEDGVVDGGDVAAVARTPGGPDAVGTAFPPTRTLRTNVHDHLLFRVQLPPQFLRQGFHCHRRRRDLGRNPPHHFVFHRRYCYCWQVLLRSYYQCRHRPRTTPVLPLPQPVPVGAVFCR